MAGDFLVQQQAQAAAEGSPEPVVRASPSPRGYQQDLIELAIKHNVIISLATSAGKTLIAAEVIRRKLPELKAECKAVLFMAPTNPLVAQQADVALGKTHGFRTKAYHGSVQHSYITQWDRQRWFELLQEVDVLCMTPDVLLHTLSHGVFKMSDIGLMIFDEAHHSKSDHPYNQLMQDFYHPLPASERPQILGLTASPEGMEQDTRKRKTRNVHMGLQHNLNAWLVTVPEQGPLREELDRVVPKPTTHFVTYDSAFARAGVVGDSLQWLNWTKEHLLRPAKRCDIICELLRGQELLAQVGLCESRNMASFENFTEGGRVAVLDKQICGVIYCLEHLGPWCAAAAAYLDLLAPPVTAEEEAAAAERAATHAGNLWQGEGGKGEEEDGGGNPVIVQGGDTCRVFEDELGGPPEQLLGELRTHLAGLVQFIDMHAQQPNLSHIVTPAELQEALTPRPNDLPAIAAANASAAKKAAEAMEAVTSDPAAVAAAAEAAGKEVELEWCARGLLRLAAKVALLITMNVLADVLVDNQDLKKQLMDEAAGDPSSRHLEQRSSGSLQGFAEVLLRRVPFTFLEAQVWPNTPQGRRATWNGPPLLTDKVVKLLRLLEADRQRCLQEEAARQAAATAADPSSIQPQEGWWASMVFVETKLSALVLSKLLSSLPTMRRHLRAGYLLGDTRSEKTGSLAMNNKQQALVVQGFRDSSINVLIATSVGSEGMDFRQCQLVVAFDLPKDVTSYIQCRGRARKRGSRYCFLQAKDSPHSIQHIIIDADQLELRAMAIAAANRGMLADAKPGGKAVVQRDAPEEEDTVTRLSTPCGAAVTTRLAQKMLAAYCSKLPGCDRATILAPYYKTKAGDQGLFYTTVYLPSNCGIGGKVEDAPPAASSRASKQQAALHALRLLYQAGKLNDHLQPVWITQRHSKHLEAEATPQAISHIRLRRPLQPKLLDSAWTHQQQHQQHQQQQQQECGRPGVSGQQQHAAGASAAAASTERVVTLHLHTFVYGKVARKHSRHKQGGAGMQQPASAAVKPSAAAAGAAARAAEAAAGGSSDAIAADAFSTALGSAEAALMAAVVGTDEALAALPGGPVVAGGMDGPPVSKLCFGVLMWEPLHMPDLMQWPVWIEKQLYIMDVVYEGPVQLTAGQVETLLGYQKPLNKFVNWNITRTQWLKTARAEEAAVIAQAPIKLDLLLQPDGHVRVKLQVWEPLPEEPEEEAAADPTAAAGDAAASAPAAAAGATGEQQQQQQQQQQQPGSIRSRPRPVVVVSLLGGTEDGVEDEEELPAAAPVALDDTDSDSGADADADTDADADPAAAPQTAQELLARQPLAFKPRLLEELVRFKRAGWPDAAGNGSSGSGGAPPGDDGDSMQVERADATATAAGDADADAAAAGAAAATAEAYLQPSADDWQPPKGVSYLIVPLRDSAAAAACGNSNGQQEQQDPQQHIPAEVYPSLNIQAAGLDPSCSPAIDWPKVSHMGQGIISLPALVAKTLGLSTQPTQTPERMVLPPVDPPPGLLQEEYEAAAAAGAAPPLAGAATMTPLPPELRAEAVSKLEAALRGRILVAGHSSQVYSALGVAAGLTPSSSLSEAVSALVTRYGMAGSAAAGMQNHLPTFAPLLASDNPDMAAAVMISANLAAKDPEQRPMLGWKVGKTDDGQPIWQSTDRHDDYYRLRFGVTGFRPDVPMLAVKSSRGLTDCCLLPPRVEVSALAGPQQAAPELQQQQQATGSAAGAGAGAAAGSSSVAVGSKRVSEAAAEGTTPDKRRLVEQQQEQTEQDRAAAAVAAAVASTRLVLEKLDRLADWEQQQVQQQHLVGGLTQAQLDEAGKRLAAMSSSARRKAWAQHRVMFLPLELGWVLPLTSPEWSQLQLVPNIVYRIDSMLQASCMHKQLRELLRGGGPKAATQVFNYPLPPEPDDEATARELGWLPPAPVRNMLADQHALSINLPPLFDQEEMLLPEYQQQQPQQQDGGGGQQQQQVEGAAGAVRLAQSAGAAAAVDGTHSSSLPSGLAAHMLAPEAPAVLAANGINGHAAAGERKRGRSPAPDDTPTAAVADAAQDGAGEQLQQQQLAVVATPSAAADGDEAGSNGSLSAAPRSKKAKAAAVTASAAVPSAAEAAALALLPPGQQPPSAAALPTMAERRAQLASVPLPSRTLVLMALTCASCREAFDFERLEFLGDVILKALAAHIMLGAMPEGTNEGELSVAKAQVVRNVRLARLGRSRPLLLQYQLRLHPFDNSLWTPNGAESVLGLLDEGPRTTFKGKRLADGIEALIGAFYLTGAAAEAAKNTAEAAAAAGSGGGSGGGAGAGAGGAGGSGSKGAAAASASAGFAGCGDSEIYGVQEPSVPAMLDAASWVWHRVSQPGLEAAAAVCEVLEVLPQGALELIRRSPMQLTLSAPDKPGHRGQRASATTTLDAAAGSGVSHNRQLTEKLAAKMGSLLGGPFPYTFRDPSWLVQSLTHVSVLGGVSYQRLEFLGDAIMDLIVSLRLLAMGHGTQRHHGPAELTKARASAVANLTMARASVLAGLHQVLRCNSWRLLYTTHKFAQETIAQHAQDYPHWRPFYAAGEDSDGGGGDNGQHTEAGGAAGAAAEGGVRQEEQQQQGAAGGGSGGGSGSGGGEGAAAAAPDAEMADADNASPVPANGTSNGKASAAGGSAGSKAGKWGSAAAVIAATAAAAAAAAENCSLEQLAPLTPLGAVSAAELEQRLNAPCPDDSTIWLAVWLRKKELAALQAVAEAVNTNGSKAGEEPGSSKAGEGGASEAGGGASAAPAAVAAAGRYREGSSSSSDDGGAGAQQQQQRSSRKVPKKKCPKVMADLVESLVAAVFVDSGCDWASTWAAAEYLLWREGVVELPPVNLPEDPAAAAAAAVAAAVAAADKAAAEAAAGVEAGGGGDGGVSTDAMVVG